MFTTATHAEIEELADFSWQVQSNITTASYPMDRYKSKQDMIDIMHRYLDVNPKYPHDTVLVLREGENILGVVILDVECENSYLHACGMYGTDHLSRVYAQLKLWCCRHFKGFHLHIGLPAENQHGGKAAMEIGGEIIEASDFLRLDPQDLMPLHSEPDVRMLSMDHFDEFAAFIDKADQGIPPDMLYWNADKIRANFHIWHIYTLHIENKMVGCLNVMKAEGFGEIFRCTVMPQYRTRDILRSFLTKGILSEFTDNKAYILYSVEADEGAEREAAIQSGFKQVGSFICYQIVCE